MIRWDSGITTEAPTQEGKGALAERGAKGVQLVPAQVSRYRVTMLLQAVGITTLILDIPMGTKRLINQLLLLKYLFLCLSKEIFSCIIT